MSYRGEEWTEFSVKVLRHVEDYCVNQYGDYPEDEVTRWSFEQFIKVIQKYTARAGHNQREGQDELDMLKIAHYACLAHSRLKDRIHTEKKFILNKDAGQVTIGELVDYFEGLKNPVEIIIKNIGE